MTRYAETTIYADGTHDKTIAFRVDDPSRDGCKMIVCGSCVNNYESFDPRATGGWFLCEACGEKHGRQEANELANARAYKTESAPALEKTHD